MMQQQRRMTKYYREVQQILAELGHGTNAQIAFELRKRYPAVSDTTVHRVTSRLAEDGKFGIAPSADSGATRYDAIGRPHDHFHCKACDGLRNIIITRKIRNWLQAAMDDCTINGPITISGDCGRCQQKEAL